MIDLLKLIRSGVYEPYFVAVKTVLGGTPVEGLDEIKEQCSVEAEDIDRRYRTLVEVVISSIANSENRILMGEDPKKAYAAVHPKDLKKYREAVRGNLVNMITLWD